MKNNNPCVIPRNYLVEEALNYYVKDSDYSKLDEILEVINNTFAYSNKQLEYAKKINKSDSNEKTY